MLRCSRVGRAGEAFGRLARDHDDRADLALGGRAHRIQAEQRARRHDDARAGPSGEVDQIRVLEQLASAHRDEDPPCADGRLGDVPEHRSRGTFHDDVGESSQFGERHHR
jgi:hypothetical protein